MLPLHGFHIGLRISVIYPSLVSCDQTMKIMFRILSEQLQVLLTALATSVLLKRTQHSWDPSCTDLGHVQLFMNNGPNCSLLRCLSLPLISTPSFAYLPKSNFPISGTFLQKSLPQDAQCEDHFSTLFPT